MSLYKYNITVKVDDEDDKYNEIGDASGKLGDFSDSDKRCASRFSIDYVDVRDFLES